MSASTERPSAVPDVAGAALGCWSCDVVSRLPPDDPRVQLRMLAFLSEHEAHRPWIDLTGRVPQDGDPVD